MSGKRRKEDRENNKGKSENGEEKMKEGRGKEWRREREKD